MTRIGCIRTHSYAFTQLQQKKTFSEINNKKKRLRFFCFIKTTIIIIKHVVITTVIIIRLERSVLYYNNNIRVMTIMQVSPTVPRRTKNPHTKYELVYFDCLNRINQLYHIIIIYT